MKTNPTTRSLLAVSLVTLAAACGNPFVEDCTDPVTVTVSLSSLGDAADANDCTNDCIAYFAGADACTFVPDGGIVTGADEQGQPTYFGDAVQCGDADPGKGGTLWSVESDPTQSCNLFCFQADIDAGAGFNGTCSFGWSFGTTVSCTYQPSCSYQGFT